MEDLWRQVFPFGTEWHQFDMVYQYNWNFSNLEHAFEEGGELYNRTVYIFGCTEPHKLCFKDQTEVRIVPVVVAVVSPLPPTDNIAILSVERETEDIVPMNQLKMDWVAYYPSEHWRSRVGRPRESQIFILTCRERRASFKHWKSEYGRKFWCCWPYFYQPEAEMTESTVAHVLFPTYTYPVFCEFDWEQDNLEKLIDKLIEEGQLSADQKEPFKDFVMEKAREAKKANHEAREARNKALEEVSEETMAAFTNMRFYKFYPVPMPDTPDVSALKSRFISKHCGNAHQVF